MEQSVEIYLISEIKLTPIQAKIFLLVTCNGKMDSKTMSKKLRISNEVALSTAKELIDLGGFIDYSSTEFEAMHPRFTVVNMYRKLCKRENIPFKKNTIVDNIGIMLEKSYDDARTK